MRYSHAGEHHEARLSLRAQSLSLIDAEGITPGHNTATAIDHETKVVKASGFEEYI